MEGVFPRKKHGKKQMKNNLDYRVNEHGIGVMIVTLVAFQQLLGVWPVYEHHNRQSMREICGNNPLSQSLC